jgi:hypothetical protein
VHDFIKHGGSGKRIQSAGLALRIVAAARTNRYVGTKNPAKERAFAGPVRQTATHPPRTCSTHR